MPVEHETKDMFFFLFLFPFTPRRRTGRKIVLDNRGPHLCLQGSGNTDGMEHGEHGLDSKVVDHVDYRGIKISIEYNPF